jgi:hypothetical protein
MPNKYILNSDSSFMVIGKSPAWSATLSESGRVFSLTQAVNFDFSSTRQGNKHIGAQTYSSNIEYKAPEVNLSIDYLFSPYLNNELLMGFNGSGLTNKPAMLNFKDKNNNFYFFSNKNDGKTGFGPIGKTPVNTQNYDQYEAISFGNCYLTNYSLSCGIGKPPVVSTKFKASNITAQNLISGGFPFYTIKVPALDPIYGVFDYTKVFNPNTVLISGGNITGDLESRNDLNPPISVNYYSTVSITNNNTSSSLITPLKNFNSTFLESCNLNLNFNRIDLYNLGNNSVSSRKLQFPINGQIQIESLVSGFNSNATNASANNNLTSNVSAILSQQEETYDINLNFVNRRRSVTGSYNFKGAKLNSLNYTAQLNNIYKMSASFSVEITEGTGFYMYKRQQ